MAMTLTHQADYAIRALLDIAHHHPNRRTTRHIAATMDLPRGFLTQILATLVRNNLLDSLAGPSGGYTLARPPAEITLLQIIETIDGPVAGDECILGGGTCDWDTICPLHETWSQATTNLTRALATTTLAHLAATDQAIRSGTYQPPPDTPPHPTTPPRHGTSDTT